MEDLGAKGETVRTSRRNGRLISQRPYCNN